ncbi:MAG: IclR family transcriptional regulator [Rhodobacteraceae bacterium]|nr:IclR family transcriptional regulator [Paracoccaceae bacterium]
MTRALSILDLFTEAAPRLRLTDVVRLSGIDKATCHRMLRALQAGGYLDQSVTDRRYALGPAVLRLARMREAVMPTGVLLQPVVQSLAQQTQETSHASLIAGGKIVTIASAEGLHASRVHVEPGGLLTVGSTASGLACLAWGPPLPVIGPLDPALLAEARLRGYACARGTFDPDVLGIGAPIFGPDGLALGAIAVASPISRMTAGYETDIATALLRASAEATRLFAGAFPDSYPSHSG